MTALADAIFLEVEYQRFRRTGGYGVEREIGRWLRAAFARKS